MADAINIVVCVKVVPDVSVLAFDPDSRAFDPDDVVYMINPTDLVALEAAVGLRESAGAGEVTVLCMAPPSLTRKVRDCLAMGADRAIMLWDDKFKGSDSITTARILAAAVAAIGFDLVLCGDRADDGHAGVVGPALAGILEVAHISAITRLEMGPTATVHRALEKGEREVLRCGLPALFTVHPTMNAPRRPSFPAAVAALEAEVPVWGLAQLGLAEDQVGETGSMSTMVALAPPRPRPRVTMRMDSSLDPAQRMRLLMSGGVKEKSGLMLEGDARDLAARVIEIIKRRQAAGDQPAEQ